MTFAANVSKQKTISKTRAGSSRTVELKGPLPKAMNIGDGTAKKYDLMGRVVAESRQPPWVQAEGVEVVNGNAVPKAKE